jgi:4-amino-4-deoxy-L-arabinose transferase-like glycosyltransferase
VSRARVAWASPLTALLAAVAIAVVAWALFVPPFQVPDEPGGFAYTQSLAENGERPQASPPPYGSSEQRLAAYMSITDRIAAEPQLKPAWEPSAEDEWRREHERLGAGAKSNVETSQSSGHPPSYFAYQAVPYAAASGASPFSRLFLMRLWSGALMLVTTAAAWLLIGELTGRDRLLQLAGSACVGLQPMAVFMSAGVNPDGALFAAAAVALWLGVRVLRRGPTRASVAGLLTAAALAGLVKVAGLALVPAVVFVLVCAARRRGGRSRRSVALALGAGAAIVTASLVATSRLARIETVDAGLGDIRTFASYLWQFYLPRLPWQEPFPDLGELPLWHVWHKTSWGAFGWLEVELPDAVYAVLAALVVVLVAAAWTAIARARFTPGRQVLIFLALPVVTLLLGLHWVEFWSLKREEGGQTQGRYLLPLMPIAGVAVAAALSNLRARRPTGVALVLAGMVALQCLSLALVAVRFYA